MKKIKMCLIGFVLFLITALSMNSTVQAEDIDLNEYLKEKLKKHEANISQEICGNRRYGIWSVEFKGSILPDLKLDNPKLPTTPIFAGKATVKNCLDDPIEKNFGFEKTEENSFEITKSTTITTGVGGTVSAEIPFVGAEIKATFNFEMETSESTSRGKLESVTWTDNNTYPIRPNTISTFQFIIQESKAVRIPYTGNLKFIGSVEVTMRALRRHAGKYQGIVYLYEDDDYDGHERWFHIGDYIDLTKGYNDEIGSIKIQGPLYIDVWKDMRYKGDHKKYTKSAEDLGDFDDEISSFKVFGNPEKGTIQLNKYLTEEECSIEIDGYLNAAIGVETYTDANSDPVECDVTETHHEEIHGPKLKNTKIIPGGKIVSRKIRPGAKRR